MGELLAYWKRTPALTLVMKRAKAISLFILAVYARPSDCERLSMARGHFGIAQSRNSYINRIRGSKESKSSHKLTPELFVEFFDESSPDVDLCPARAMAAYGDAVDDSKRVPRAAMVHPYGYFVSEALRPFPGADGFEFSANLENYERSYVACRNRHRHFQRRVGAPRGLFSRCR